MEEVKLSDVIERLKIFIVFVQKQWYKVILAGLLGGFSFGLFGYLTKPKYTAAISFTLDGEADAGSGLMSLAAQFGIDAGGSGSMFSGNNLVQLIISRKLLEQTLVQHKIGTTETYADRFLKLYKLKFKTRELTYPCFKIQDTVPAKFTPFQDSVMFTLINTIQKKHIAATIPDKKADIYLVEFTTHDPLFSIDFVKSLMGNLGSMYTRMKTAKSASNVAILEGKVDSLRAIITGAIRQRAATVDANLNPVFQTPMASVQERQVEISIATAALTEVAKNLEISKYLLMKQAPLFNIIDEPKMPLLRQKASSILLACGGSFLFVFLLFIYWLISKPFQSFTKVYIKEKNK
jgi:capsule polysaccharide export protein KpsE/RkpR